MTNMLSDERKFLSKCMNVRERERENEYQREKMNIRERERERMLVIKGSFCITCHDVTQIQFPSFPTIVRSV